MTRPSSIKGSTVRALLIAAFAFGLCPSAGSATAVAASLRADSVPGIPGLPTGVPAAATAAEPALAEPTSSEWPFPSNFSRTSGTGLLAGGASLWTDFLYDDHGPLGSPVGIVAVDQSLRPRPGARRLQLSGRAGREQRRRHLPRRASATCTTPPTWRVDWNTLANADVPIAEWTFSTEGAAPAAGETWPANAGLRSAGIQYALVVSAQHARLLEVASGTPVAGAELHTEVNLAAHSFVVRIPTSVLPVSGTLAGAPRGRPGQPGGHRIRRRCRPRTEACPAPPMSTTSPSAATSRRASWSARPNSCPSRALASAAHRRARRRRRSGSGRSHPRGRVREHVDGERPGQHARHRETSPSTRSRSTGRSCRRRKRRPNRSRPATPTAGTSRRCRSAKGSSTPKEPTPTPAPPTSGGSSPTRCTCPPPTTRPARRRPR